MSELFNYIVHLQSTIVDSYGYSTNNNQQKKKKERKKSQLANLAILLGCELDDSLSGKAMALKVNNKINSRLHFLYRKNRYLLPYLKRLLSNAIIQPHFDYACSAWYPNLNKKFKSKLQIIQNKCNYVLSSTRQQKLHWDKRI